VQSFMLTEVRDCDLLIVVTSSTFLKKKAFYVSTGVGWTPGEPEEPRSTKAHYTCRPYSCTQYICLYICCAVGFEDLG